MDKEKTTSLIGRINDREFKSAEELDSYMAGQFYLDCKNKLEEKCKEVIKELDNTLINQLSLFDKQIKINITIDKDGYFIVTKKEKYEGKNND